MNTNALFELNYMFCEGTDTSGLQLDVLNEIISPDSTFDNNELATLLRLLANESSIDEDVYRNLSSVTELDSEVNTPQALHECATLLQNLPLTSIPDHNTLWNMLAFVTAYMEDYQLTTIIV